MDSSYQWVYGVPCQTTSADRLEAEIKVFRDNHLSALYVHLKPRVPYQAQWLGSWGKTAMALAFGTESVSIPDWTA